MESVTHHRASSLLFAIIGLSAEVLPLVPPMTTQPAANQPSDGTDNRCVPQARSASSLYAPICSGIVLLLPKSQISNLKSFGSGYALTSSSAFPPHSAILPDTFSASDAGRQQ
jgi:hypothetical protein